MSRGRRKKNSTSLAASMTVRSLASWRCRYPASASISEAGSARVPLLGTATRSIWPSPFVMSPFIGTSQVAVDVAGIDPAAEHEHLNAVEQLGDLLRQPLIGFVFGGDPHLAGFLEHLLALGVYPVVQRRHRTGARRPGPGPLGQLPEQLIKRLPQPPSS